jgi:mRNA-degrading endonuclease RelE of RelBE toxin-antitoxin system
MRREERGGLEWLLRNSPELLGTTPWPPGIRETDAWFFEERDTTPIFIPSGDRWPSSLREVADLADLLEPVSHATEISLPVEAEDGNADRIAWYQTFRNPDGWGIYVRESGIAAVSNALADSTPDRSHRKAAFHALYLHEYAHFLFDVAAGVLEDVVGGPVYEPHRNEVIARSPGYHETTEALCNAFAYRFSATDTRSRLAGFLRKSPVGYRDFSTFRTAQRFSEGIEETIGQILRGVSGRSALGARSLFDDRGATVSPSLVPVHLDRDLATGPWLSLITALADIRQSSRFTRELKKLPDDVRREWSENVEPMLHTDVARCQFKALKALENQYSVRVGRHYRAILQRSEDDWTVIAIGHRREAYR